MRASALLLFGICLLAPVAPAQQMDADFAKSVREWTTKPEFISPLVDHLPKSETVPSPKDILGNYIGAPRVLHYYADILKYYRALAAKSPRVRIVNIGKTDEGRDCVVVVIADQTTLTNLDVYRHDLAQLADPRGLTDAQAYDIIGKAKPIYHLTAGLHSSETGPSEMLMELAYRLATEDSPLVKSIRDRLIVTITPAADPDGRDRYVDWYYRYKIDEKNEDDNMGGPPYWGKYIFHDDNRDINYSQLPMRNLLAWYLGWHPPIVHDLHESQPFMYTFSGQAPQEPDLDPILYAELPWFSNFEMEQMTKFGMPGVWTHAYVDMWSPGYLGFMSSNHNGMLRMYETFGNGGANTMHRHVKPQDPPPGNAAAAAGATAREWYRPLPPYAEVDWSLRNNTNYMETGVLSALQLAAAFPQIVLENFYKKSLHSIEAGGSKPPFAYVIPGGLPDQTRVALMMNILRLQGVEVGRTRSEIQLKEGTFPKGSFLIKLDQPYGRLAKILLQKQVYPDPNLRTYDDSAWTMGLMAHVKTVEIADKSVLTAAADLIDTYQPAGSAVASAAAVAYAVPDTGSINMATLRWRLKDTPVRIAEKSFNAIPAGSFIVDAQYFAKLKPAVEALGLAAVALTAAPTVPMHDAPVPRLAVFSTWGSTQDVGWVRYAFDYFQTPYELIFKERVRKGNLRADYDVIVIPSQGRSAKTLVFDIQPKLKPLAYTKTDRFRYLGDYGSSEDISGGMGLEGAAEFRKFVQDGGVLITLGEASAFPPDFGIARTIDSGRPGAQFYAPGPIVNAEVLRPTHPIFYGYTEKTIPVRWANGPFLTVPRTDRGQILMQFPGGDANVLSGLMRGAAQIHNRPAIVDVPVGQGHVLLFATNPCYRWQNFGEFRMLFNAILNYKVH